MLKIKNGASKRQRRRSREQWQALLARFESAGLRVAAFCANESISEASFYRWKGLLASSRSGQDIVPGAGFVDLGPMASVAREARLELRLDLGGGVVLHLVRG
jgi:hypothetical protein